MTAIVAVEILSKEDQLKEEFYHFFSAKEGDKKTRYRMNLKFILKNGGTAILLGESISFMPDEFYGKDEFGSWIEIPLSSVIDIVPMPKKI